MHSALPQVGMSPRKGRPWRVRRRPVILTLVALASFVLFCSVFVWGSHGPDRPKFTYNGATTVEVSDSPYIYPDLGHIAEYRASHTVALPDGQSVASHTHSKLFRSTKKPQVVLVLPLDDAYPQDYLEKIIQDRLKYAKRHGYGLYARYIRDFAGSAQGDTDQDVSLEFARIFLMREAAYAFQGVQWLWYLDQDAVIMDHTTAISDTLLTPSSLTNLMIRNAPIIPPESIIHTYRRVPADRIKFIVTQNDRGISTTSFLLRNDDMYGGVLLNYWIDPLHRSYDGFNTYDGAMGPIDASLTHMVQWHPSILSRMAVVPNNKLVAYKDDGKVLKKQQFNDGDFVLHLHSTNEASRVPVDKIVGELNGALQRRKL